MEIMFSSHRTFRILQGYRFQMPVRSKTETTINLWSYVEDKFQMPVRSKTETTAVGLFVGALMFQMPVRSKTETTAL